MEYISRREFWIIVAISLVLLGLAIFLTCSISDNAEEVNLKYDQAIILEDDEQIAFAYDTATGYCYSTSKITPYNDEYVTDDKYEGKFIAFECKAYYWEAYTETQTYTDSNGKTQTRTVTKHKWSYRSSRSYENHVANVLYADYIVLPSENVIDYNKIDTVKDGSYWKYEYYAVYFDDSDYTLFANFYDSSAYSDVAIQKTNNIESMRSSQKTASAIWIVLVWFGWLLLEILTCCIFYHHESYWLEND